MSQDTQDTEEGFELFKKEQAIIALRETLDRRDTTICKKEEEIRTLVKEKRGLLLKIKALTESLDSQYQWMYFWIIGIFPFLFVLLLIIMLWLELVKGICIGNALGLNPLTHLHESSQCISDRIQIECIFNRI